MLRQGTQPARPARSEEPTGLANPETYPKALDTGLTVRQQVVDGRERIQTFRDNRASGMGRFQSVVEGTRDNFQRSIEGGTNPKDLDRGAGGLGKANNLLKLGMGVNDLAGDKGRKAWNALTGGLTSGSPEQRNQALYDLGDGVKTLTETAKAGLETARDVQKYGSAYRAASQTLQAQAPDLNTQGRRAISRDIARQVFNNVDAGDGANDARFGELRNGNQASATDLAARAHGTSNNEAKQLLRNGAEEGVEAADNALKAGIKSGARSAAGVLAKTAGRFVPGANVAIAAADAAKAVATVRDPDASVGKKTTAVITAVGSGLAATNIPVVSQVGAAVSSVSDFVGGFF